MYAGGGSGQGEYIKQKAEDAAAIQETQDMPHARLTYTYRVTILIHYDALIAQTRSAEQWLPGLTE